MLDRLLKALGDLGQDLTAEEIADALWLAERDPGGPPPPVRTGAAPAPPPDRRPGVGPGPGAGAGGGPGTPLPRAADLARALQPLRGTGSRAPQPLIDEEMAAALSAPGLFVPGPGRPPGRGVDLTLVVDSGPSMTLWEPTVRQLRTVMARLGVFGDVRTWTLEEPGDPAGAVPTVRTEGGASGRRAGEVVTPSRHQLILVVSDCVGALWQSGAMWRLLWEWSRKQPVAVLQVLPQRMWRRTALTPVPVRWQCGSPPGLGNGMLTWRRRDGGVRPAAAGAAPGAPGVAIPVLGLETRWLNSWATVVSGTGAGWVNGVAQVVGTPGAPPDRPEPAAEAPLPAERRLARFLASASPEAAELAGYLSAVPLTLPVMQLIQREMAPHTLPAHLAEAFLGGLLLHVRDDLYEFHAGVRSLLLARLTRGEAARAVGVVSDAIARSALVVRRPTGAAGAAIAAAVVRSLHGSAAAPPPAPVVVPPALVEDSAPVDRSGPVAPPVVTEPPPPADEALKPAERTEPAEPAERVARAEPVKSADGTPSPTSGATLDTPADTPADRDPGDALRPAIWGTVPSANRHFTGRTELLTQLRDQLVAGGSALLTCTLHGMGGVGKTQIAVEYAYRYAREYDVVWWVPAQQRTSVSNSLAELSFRLGLPGPHDTGEPWSRALAALHRGDPYGRWLVIFDNADRPEDIEDHLPQGSGHLIVTSRNPNWARRDGAVDVGVMTPDESVRLLRSHLPAARRLVDTEARQLAEATGHLPIALVQAAEWQATTGMSVDEHLRRFEDVHVLPALQTDELPQGYPRPLYATWQMAIDQLRRDNAEAVDLLELCAVFGPEPIPLAMLTAPGADGLPEGLAGLLADPVAVHLSLRDLSRFALARVDWERRTVEVHRLIQTVVRRKGAMSELHRLRVGHAVHCLLLRYAPQDPADSAGWERFADIQPHLLPSGALDCDVPEVRRMCVTQAHYLDAIGERAGARELRSVAWLRWRGMYGEGHPDVRALRRQLDEREGT